MMSVTPNLTYRDFITFSMIINLFNWKQELSEVKEVRQRQPKLISNNQFYTHFSNH